MDLPFRSWCENLTWKSLLCVLCGNSWWCLKGSPIKLKYGLAAPDFDDLINTKDKWNSKSDGAYFHY